MSATVEGMRNVRAICWDWNGTLLDDGDICRRTMNQVLADRGLPEYPSMAEYRRVFCFPIREFYRLSGIGDEGFVAAADQYLALLEDAVRDAGLQPRAKEVLSAVRERGIPQILASATMPDLLASQMAPHGIQDLFDDVLGITDPYVASKKAVIAGWLAASGFSASELLMIGDTNHDWEISQELGTQFLYFESGHQELDVDAPRLSALDDVLSHIDVAR